MDPFFLAVNIAVVALIGVGVLVARFRAQRTDWVESRSSMQPDRSAEELTEAVTEWARFTGLLEGDRALDAASGNEGEPLGPLGDQRG